MGEGLRQRRASQGGRQALILAAERLIALRGISGVSLREINEAAGLRNVSAAHYHFGSRDGIIEAVLAYRIPPIQARRQAMIETLGKEGRLSELRPLVGALVWPLVEEMRPRAEGNHYLRFLEQMRRERGDSPLISYANEFTPSWATIRSQLKLNLKHLPPRVATLRLRLEYEHTVSGLAFIETWLEQGELSPGDLNLSAEILIDGVVHALSGPATEETLLRLRHPSDPAT